MPADIDNIKPTRSLIDLSTHSDGDFGLDDFKLSFIFDDIVLVEYVDTSPEGDGIVRNGIYIPKLGCSLPALMSNMQKKVIL
jgi:hypothetical protein